MNAAQSVAFEEGTGAFFTAAELLNVIQLIGSSAVFIYVAWLCMTAYKDYGAELIRSKEMMAIWLRSVLVMMVLLYLIVN